MQAESIGSEKQGKVPPKGTVPVLAITDLSYTYPGADAPALCDITLSMRRGECVCITGPSGCGKTTLLLAIQDLLKEGLFDGSIRTNNGEETGVGMVFQNADTQILCTTVEDEVTFGPLNLDLSPEDVKTSVRSALEALELSGFEKRNVEELSAGEKQRLTIASVLSMNPELLLLDEPTGQLDRFGKRKLVEILKTLKQRGHTLLIIDHDLAPFEAISDRFLYMESGRIGKDPAGPSDEATKPALERWPTSNKRGRGKPPIIEINDLYLFTPEGEPLFEAAELTVHSGELVHLLGDNGTGKSTLLRSMAGFLRPESGRIRVIGMDSPRVEQLTGKVGLLFQNPERHFFAESVFAEAAFSLKKTGVPPDRLRARVMEALEGCGVAHLAGRSPFTLSFGEQHRVALASVIATRPRLLLLDEPFSGLDITQRVSTLRLLSELRERLGTAVLIASHDQLPDARWADRRVVLKDGKIEQA